jgi:hypothetical protein
MRIRIFHKIIALYLQNTLTAVAIVHVADYEVNLIIFCIFYYVYSTKI